MKENRKVPASFFVNKYTAICICITSILAYCILNFIFYNQKIKIPLIFRIYYIILSIVLFILIDQIKKLYNQYVSKSIVIFFLLIIFISTSVFIISINEKDALNQFIMYIDFSKESFLLIETFASYALSEYYSKNKELNKGYYSILILIIASLGLIYYSNMINNFIKIICFIIEATLFVKIILNMKKSVNSKIKGWNILNIYISSTIIILMTNIYGFYNDNKDISNILIEIIHLINFTIAWNVITIKLIKEPYKTLSNSLNKKHKELDKLNDKIVVRNRQLEQSINILKSKEYLYSTFFRFMPHPIIILNADNDRILFVNKQFLKFAGISKIRDIINEKVNKYMEFIPTNLQNKDYNAIFHVGDKKKFVEAKLLSTYSDSTKKLILIKDNTSKVKTEEIRKEVENRKIQENIRTEFLSSISHDLKTPINVIYSAMQVEKIYIEKEDLEVLKKYNNISKQNCISLIKLTNNLIDNSRINSHFLVPRLENKNIVEVIEDDVMSLIDYVKWNNVDLIFDTNTEECYLHIDHEFMFRIILNLVSNAVKFTPSGGKIYVIISDNNDNVNICVKDSGSGIEKEFIDKAFNRYSVGENYNTGHKSGTGIGLSVVKQLVKLQGGNIEIKRNEDIGTTVSMEFKKGE